eukprot:GILK01007157.1.p1 GENE.GILK01007157.1~~GILK01007157.1.p1  ORF type:complete len:316 (+),score=33.47 GILK01007157.1:48-995(+)
MKIVWCFCALLVCCVSADCENPLFEAEDRLQTPQTLLADQPCPSYWNKLSCCDEGTLSKLSLKFTSVRDEFSRKISEAARSNHITTEQLVTIHFDNETRMMEFNEGIALLDDLHSTIPPCTDALLTYLKGTMCMSCETEYEPFVSVHEEVLSVIIDTSTCDQLYDACSSFIRHIELLHDKLGEYPSPSGGTSSFQRPCVGEEDCRQYVCGLARGLATDFPSSSQKQLTVSQTRNVYRAGGYASFARGKESTMGSTSHPLSPGAIAGIVIGVVGAAVLVTFGAVFYLRKQREARRRQQYVIQSAEPEYIALAAEMS